MGQILDKINFPADIRGLTVDELGILCEQIRKKIVDSVSMTGGHLGASLGVVELTVALHYIFNTPKDRLIWDVGHQSYPHKILTGRKDKMLTLRQGGGIAGFTNRSESEYDPFGAGHSSTSISAGLGMAVGKEIKGEHDWTIAVIGDGSISAGQAYEALNNASSNENARLIVILNDNDMSIAPPVGAMSAYLSRLLSSKPLMSIRHFAREIEERFPGMVSRAARRAEEYALGMITGGTLFEELGFYYVGPLDGHNLDHLLPVLRNVRDNKEPGPVLLHVVTKKGKGYAPAEAAADKYHGVGKFDAVTGALATSSSNLPSYTSVFGKALVKEAERDNKIVAITAAMPTGTGLDLFAEKFPARFFDVGIAEQHAVTFGAGLACEGLKPFIAIYSSFLQRGYDQVVHDVALQKLPVRFAIDRAGLVGADGATHHGNLDLAFLCPLPGMVIMAPADEAELVHMIATACSINDAPSAIRYPRGEGVGVPLPDKGDILPIGKGRIISQGQDVAILSIGTRLGECQKAMEELAQAGIRPTLADARFAKPFDVEMVENLARNHKALLIVEEGCVGGFSSLILQHLTMSGLLDNGLKVRPLLLPDRFIEHDTLQKQMALAGIDAVGIIATVKALV